MSNNTDNGSSVKKGLGAGLGFAGGMIAVPIIIVVALCICCFVLYAISSSNSSKTSLNSSSGTSSSVANSSLGQSSSSSSTKPISITLSGNSNKDTESFTLHAGTAKMVATTSGSTVGSFTGITLQSENGNDLFSGITGNELDVSTNGSEQGHNDTVIRGLTDGKYYLHVISGVDWKVTITQN